MSSSGLRSAPTTQEDLTGWVELDDYDASVPAGMSTILPSQPSRTTAPSAASGWRDVVVDRLADLLDLEKNWDGRGSEAVSFQDAIDVLEFLTLVMHQDTAAPAVGPLSSGGIGLAWAKDSLEVEAVFDHARDERALYITDGDEEHEAPIKNAALLFASVAAQLTID